MISFLSSLLVVIVVPLYSASTSPMNTTYSIGKVTSAQNICGRNVLLPINASRHELVSMGNASGDCFATLVVGLTSKFTCKICVSLEKGKLILDADVMNITFTGEAEKVLLKFSQKNFTETCFEGRRLDIFLKEEEEYAKKMANGEGSPDIYSFKFVLEPKCSEEPISKCSSTMDRVVNLSISILVILVFLVFVSVYRLFVGPAIWYFKGNLDCRNINLKCCTEDPIADDDAIIEPNEQQDLNP